MRRLRPARASRSKPRTTRVKYDCLDVLTGGEARTVLHELLLSRPDLIPDAKRTADALLAKVSFAEGAENVYITLQPGRPCRPRRDDLAPQTPQRHIAADLRREVHALVGLAGSLNRRAASV